MNWDGEEEGLHSEGRVEEEEELLQDRRTEEQLRWPWIIFYRKKYYFIFCGLIDGIKKHLPLFKMKILHF